MFLNTNQWQIFNRKNLVSIHKKFAQHNYDLVNLPKLSVDDTDVKVTNARFSTA